MRGLFLALLTAAPAAALESAPIYKIDALGGQNFYSGKKRDFAGLASALFAPAMRLDADWSLLPEFGTRYRGSQQVVDIVGAGTLFEEEWDNSISAKGIYARAGSLWLFKPYMGFKYQFLRQDSEERLGLGLFDYYQWHGGLETEFLYRDPFGIRLGVEYFQTVFPNYVSLESQTSSLGAAGLARELAGAGVLDTQNLLASLSGETPLYEFLLLEGLASFLYENFPNQHVVDMSGNFTSPLRNDFISTLRVRLGQASSLNPDRRVLGSLETSISYDASSQNSFDAGQVLFFTHYYSYGEFKLSPTVSFQFSAPRSGPVWTLGAAWWYRRYPYRQAQDANGFYQDREIHTSNWSLTSRLSYPLSAGFNLISQLEYGRSSSNQHFERFYRYNYTAASYQIGLEWGN